MRETRLTTNAKINTNLKNIHSLHDLYELTVITPITLKFDNKMKWKEGTTRILNGDLYVFYRDHNHKISNCEVKPMFDKKWYKVNEI